MARTREGPGKALPGAAGRVHAGLKMAVSLLAILLSSLSRAPWFVAAVGSLELVVISCLEARAIARVLKACAAAALFAMAVLAPSALAGNLHGAAFLVAKVLACVAAASLVSATSSWADLSSGLAALRLPGIFILVLDLAVKYIVLLGGLTLDMLAALRLRSVGIDRDKTGSLAAIAGTVFLKSQEAAADMYGAMECRGFTGNYRKGRHWRPGLPDAACAAAGALLLVMFFSFGTAR